MLTATFFLALELRMGKKRKVGVYVQGMSLHVRERVTQYMQYGMVQKDARRQYPGFKTPTRAECSHESPFSSVWSAPLTLDYSWMSARSSLVKCQQTEFPVMHTNNQLNRQRQSCSKAFPRADCSVMFPGSCCVSPQRAWQKWGQTSMWRVSGRYQIQTWWVRFSSPSSSL